METAALTEILPINLLQIRPITVVTNTLNALNAIYTLKSSPLKNLILNPLSGQIQSQCTVKDITYKGFVSNHFERIGGKMNSHINLNFRTPWIKISFEY